MNGGTKETRTNLSLVLLILNVDDYDFVYEKRADN
jgi:hypothetical protein